MEESYSVQEILAPLTGKVRYGSPDARFNTYCIDSRFVREGILFVPLLGQQRDGHQFILDAVARGATATLVRSGHHLIPELLRVLSDSQGCVSTKYAHTLTLIEVRHTLVALQKLASWYRRKHESAQVVGITGSVGKTQTKEMLMVLLGSSTKVIGTDKNFNNEIGVPLTLSKLRPDTQYAVVEMAMRGRGEISLLSRIAQPNIGLITNTLGSHIGLLGSGEEIAKAKSEIVDGMKSSSKLWLNLNDRYLPLIHQELEAKDAFKRGLKVAYFDAIAAGVDPTAPKRLPALQGADSPSFSVENPQPSIMALGVRQAGLLGSSFSLCTSEGCVNINLKVLGRGAVENFLCASALALDMGLSLGDLPELAEGIAATPQRLMPYELAKGIFLLDDSYNSSPASTHDALDLLESLGNSMKQIIVMGDMLELGKYESYMHRQVAERIFKLPPCLVIGIGPRMAALREIEVPDGFDLLWYHGLAEADDKIQQGFPIGERGGFEPSCMGMVDDLTIRRISDRLLNEITGADKPVVILVKGSRALHLERLVRALMSYYGKEARIL